MNESQQSPSSLKQNLQYSEKPLLRMYFRVFLFQADTKKLLSQQKNFRESVR